MKINRHTSRYGFTLAEILVAISVMSILGTFLTVMLHDGMKMWRLGERRRQMMERSSVAFDLIREDFAALLPPPADRDTQVAVDFFVNPEGFDYLDLSLGLRKASSGDIRLEIGQPINVRAVNKSQHEVAYLRSNEDLEGRMEFKFSLSVPHAVFTSAELSAVADGPAEIRIAFGNEEGNPSGSWITVAGGEGMPEMGETVDLTQAIAEAKDVDQSVMFVRLVLLADGDATAGNTLLRGRTGDGPRFSFRGRVSYGDSELPTPGQFFAVPDGPAGNNHRLMFYRSIRSTGDVAEVVYCVRDGKLWRGVNTDPRIEQSLFRIENDEFIGPDKDDQRWAAVADGVLFFGLRFWGRRTERWAPPLDENGRLDPEYDDRVGRWGWQPGWWQRDGETRDWGLPLKMQAVLVVRPVSIGGYTTELIEMKPHQQDPEKWDVTVSSTEGMADGGIEAMHARIGNEWVRYSNVIGGKRFLIAPGGRAQRAFDPDGGGSAIHKAGEDVIFGETRILTVELPGGVPDDPLE